MTVVAQAMTGFFHPRRIGHVNLYVGDYERSLAFYRDIVGLGDGWLRPEIGGAFLNNGATHHDIGFIPWNSPVARTKATGPGLNHLGIELETETDLVAGYRKALAEGETFAATVDHLVAHSVYSFDPDGHGIEIYSDTGHSFKDAEFLKLKRASTDWAPGATEPVAEPRYVADHRPKVYESSLFHAQKLTGVVLVTEAYDEALTYYRRTVGFAPAFTCRDGGFTVLSGTAGEHDVALFAARAGRPMGFHHMSFRVFDETDLLASREAARKRGVAIVREIDHPLRRGVVLADPDDMKVLFYVDRRPIGEAELRALSGDEALWLV